MDLTLESDDQDRIMHLCILDTEFLSQVMRKKLAPSHFSSDVRRRVFRTIKEFYDAYGKAPGEDILYEIEGKIRKKRIKEEDREIYEDYLDRVISIPEFPESLVRDRLDEFIKVRTLNSLTNDLLRHKERFDVDPDKPIQLIRDAMRDLDSSLGRALAESILHDPANSIQELEFVTKFGLDPIDAQLGGGLKRGNYVVIQGYTGMGKSWSINHLAKMAVRFGNSVLVIPTEMSNRAAKLRFRMSFTGLTDSEALQRAADVKKQVTKSMLKGSDIFLLSEEEKGMRVDELPGVVEETEDSTGKEIPAILLDSADELLPPNGRYKNKIDENTAIHTFLKNYAKNENKLVITTAQVQRQGETKFWLSAANVGDNINKFRKATVGLSINSTPIEKKRWIYRLWLLKNTDGREGARVWVRRDFSRGQFVTKYGAYDRFMWDDFINSEPVMDD